MHARERMKLVREVLNKDEWAEWRQIADIYFNPLNYVMGKKRQEYLALVNERIRALLLPNGGK